MRTLQRSCTFANLVLSSVLIATIGSLAFAQPAQNVSIHPTSIDFGVILLGLWCDTTIVVTNGGPSTLVITGAESDQYEYTVESSFPMEIPPFDSAVVAIRYSAMGGGGIRGVVTFVSNDDMSPHAVEVEGRGLSVARVDEHAGTASLASTAITSAIVSPTALRVTINAQRGERISLEVDMFGRQVRTLYEGSATSNRDVYSCATRDIPVGLYYVALRTKSMRCATPIMLRR